MSHNQNGRRGNTLKGYRETNEIDNKHLKISFISRYTEEATSRLVGRVQMGRGLMGKGLLTSTQAVEKPEGYLCHRGPTEEH